MTQKAPASIAKTVVLVGLMGAGKTSVGRRLSALLELPFVDADAEIEKAAGCTIADIFAQHGEAAFRDGERRVIRRLLDGPPHVLATGGGAFMNRDVRTRIRARGVSVWLRADLELLVSRVGRRRGRPLLDHGDTRQILTALMAERYPVYGKADIIIDTVRESTAETAGRVLAAVRSFLADEPQSAAKRKQPVQQEQ